MAYGGPQIIGTSGFVREKDKLRDFNVLVTGFAPFRKVYPVNPSGLIASALPTSLPVPGHETQRIYLIVPSEPLAVSYDHVREVIPKLYNQEKDGRQIPIDFALHIGMAGGRNYYSIETRAHRDGYTVGDVDGKMCRYANDGTRLPQDRIPKPDHLVDFNVNNSAICGPSEDETSTSSTEPPSPALGPGKADASPLTIPDDLSQVDGSDDSIKKPKRSVDNSTQKQKRPLKQPTLTSNVENWSTCQPLLDPTISPFLIYQRWTAALNKPGSSLSATASTTANKEGADFIDVRISTDAGRYLCEYIYYASLAHCNVKSAVRGKEPQANVLFLHVPGDADQAAVEKGVHVTVELIKAAVFELDQTEKSRALGRMVRGGEGRKGSVRTVSSAAGSLTSLVGEMKALKVEEWLALSPDDDGDASGRLTGDGEAR